MLSPDFAKRPAAQSGGLQIRREHEAQELAWFKKI